MTDTLRAGPQTRITLHFAVRLMDGTEMDSTYGGEPAAFEKARPPVDCYARKVKRLAAAGSGRLAPMVNQTCITSSLFARLESLRSLGYSALSYETPDDAARLLRTRGSRIAAAVIPVDLPTSDAGAAPGSSRRLEPTGELSFVAAGQHPTRLGRRLLRDAGAELAMLSGSGAASFALFGADVGRSELDALCTELTSSLGCPVASCTTLERMPPVVPAQGRRAVRSEGL